MTNENGELPVENVGDGDGTRVAGPVLPTAFTAANDEAQFVPFWQAFKQASATDRRAWCDAQPIGDLVELAALAITASEDLMFALLIFGMNDIGPEDIKAFLDVGQDSIIARAGTSNANEIGAMLMSGELK